MEKQEKKQIGTFKGFLIILIALIVGFFIFSGGSKDNNQPPTTQNNTPDALDMMTSTFTGDYNRDQIKIKVDEVLNLYKLPINDENYSRTGSMLISLKKENNVKEMDMLNCMINGYKSESNITLQQMAALCATISK